MLLPAIAIGGALAFLLHTGARLQMRAIKRRQSPHSFTELTTEPPGESVYLDRPDGTRIHAIWQGSGPTVLLAHGFGLSACSWSLLWPKLIIAGYRVIAFEHRGHGQSTIGAEGIGTRQMAADYRAVLEHFNVQDAVVVGHSLGGYLALVMQLQHGEALRGRIRGIILAGAGAGNMARGAPQYHLQIPLLESGLLRKMSTTEPYSWLIAASVFGNGPYPEAIRAFCHDYWAQDHHALKPLLEALIRESYYERLAAVTTPCIVLAGTKDRTVPRWHFEELQRRLPRCRTRWLEGSGHLLNWERTDAIAELIAELRAGHSLS